MRSRWTIERIAELRQMMNDPAALSTAEIAAHFGVSEAAVFNAAHYYKIYSPHDRHSAAAKRRWATNETFRKKQLDHLETICRSGGANTVQWTFDLDTELLKSRAICRSWSAAARRMGFDPGTCKRRYETLMQQLAAD